MAVAPPPLSGAVREAMLLLWVLQGQELMLVHLPGELLAQPNLWLPVPPWALPCAHQRGTAGHSVTASAPPLSGGHSVSCSGRLSAWVRLFSVPCLHSGPCRSGCPGAPRGTPWGLSPPQPLRVSGCRGDTVLRDDVCRALREAAPGIPHGEAAQLRRRGVSGQSLLQSPGCWWHPGPANPTTPQGSHQLSVASAWLPLHCG